MIKNFAYQDALNAYSNIYGKDIVNVTESQAYDQTNDAVWYLMKTYGITGEIKLKKLVLYQA